MPSIHSITFAVAGSKHVRPRSQPQFFDGFGRRTLRHERMSVTVRKLAAADLASYRALHRHGLAEATGAFVQSVEEDAAIPDETVAAMLERGEGWGAFIDGKLVAKLTIDTLPYAILAHTRWLHAMYAHPDARGTGAAKALVDAAVTDARASGVTRVNLWVNPENARARRFYEQLGFREAGRVPGGLRQGARFADDMLMCLLLDQPPAR